MLLTQWLNVSLGFAVGDDIENLLDDVQKPSGSSVAVRTTSFPVFEPQTI